MQENNFEKGIRQKMDELKLTPSAPVWQKIEAQIRKRKERRRIIFWLLPVMLVAGGIVLWKATLHNHSVAVNNNQTTAQQTKKPAHTNNINTLIKGNDSLHLAGKLFKKPIQQNAAQATKQNSVDVGGKNVVLKEQKNKTAIKPSIESSIQNSTAQALINKEAGHGVLKKLYQPINDSTSNKSIATTAGSEVTKTLQDSTVNNHQDSILKRDTTALKDTVQLKPLLKSARKWKMVVQARIGSSGTTKIFEGSNQKSMQDALSYIPSPTSGTPQNLPPAQPSGGLSYGFSMNIKRPVAKNIYFITGLQYGFYSTHLQVGQKIDSSATMQFSMAQAAVYNNSNRQTKYKTRYHFIELPLGIQYELFKKLPLQVQHGFSIGQLLSSNALVYDSAANVYYKSTAGLHKTAFSFFTAIEYKIARTKKMELWLGPQVQYGITPFYKTSTAQKQHMLFVGFSTSMGF